MKQPITHSRLLELLIYDPASGLFRRRKNGAPAGTLRPDGYWQFYVDGVVYLRHRLAWFYMTGSWPARGIDHINIIRGDDRFANLREATQSQNGANKRLQKNNKSSGVKGVSFNPPSKRPRAMIMKGRKSIHLGYFDTIEQAHAAYLVAAAELFGEFANAGDK